MFYTHLFSPYNYVTTPKLFRLRDVGSSKQLSPKNLVAGTHPQLRVKLFSFGKILYHDQPSTRVEPSVPEPSGKCFESFVLLEKNPFSDISSPAPRRFKCYGF